MRTLPVGKHASAQALRQRVGIRLDGEIERRLVAMRARDGAREVLAVERLPAPIEPFGRVEGRVVELGEQHGAFLRDPPQHRIDQARKTRRTPIGLHQAYAEIDRRMIGHVEEKDLRRADQQCDLDARGIARKAALEKFPDQMMQRAEPAQHRRDQLAGERAVALGERHEARMRVTFQLRVERAAPAQHVVEDVGRDAAGGKPWDFRGRNASCRCHEVR